MLPSGAAATVCTPPVARLKRIENELGFNGAAAVRNTNSLDNISPATLTQPKRVKALATFTGQLVSVALALV